MDNIRPLRSEADYEWAIAEITKYFDVQPEVGSPDGDRFDVLGTLIAAYEERHFPIQDPDPIDVLRHAIEEGGRRQADLADILGSRSRASEVLNRKRALTVDMIHKISTHWNIPADLLVRPYHLSNENFATPPAKAG